MSGEFEDDGLDLRAAEYVLGTLDHDERAAFSQQLDFDRAAKRAVAGWETRLADLVGLLPGITPAPIIWDRIEAAISGRSSATTHAFKVIDGGGVSASDVGRALKQSRDRWRMGALLSGAIAAALLVVVGGRMIERDAEPVDATYVAAVNRGGDKPALIVRVDLKTGQVLVRPVDANAPKGHSLELWYIGGDKTPRSLGVVDQTPSKLTLPTGATGAATFAISVEPPGGSKTGSPTGPVVYSGQLVKE